ncbi:MAG: alginate lyase family protein, partial [bacterium]
MSLPQIRNTPDHARHTPPSRLVRKALRRARLYLLGTIRNWAPPQLSDKSFQLLLPDSLRSPEALRKHFKERRAPWVGIAGDDPSPLREKFRTSFPDDASAIIAAANRFASHEYNLLGSGPKKFLTPLEWNHDFISGYRWPRRHIYLLHPIVRLHRIEGQWVNPDRRDPKVPWELGRCQWMITLAQAFALTGDEKFAQAALADQQDFIAANPVETGIQWACPMDVALRAVSWLVALPHLRHSAHFAPSVAWSLTRSLAEHGFFLRSHLEASPDAPRTNHYLADLLGLLALGALLPELSTAAQWRSFARDEFEREIMTQVGDDGLCHEASLPYHRLDAEIFLLAEILATQGGCPFSGGYRERLEKMLIAHACLLKPSGQIPQWGDNDSGRAMPFSPRFDLDGRYLLSHARRLFPHHPNFDSARDDAESFWIFGPAEQIVIQRDPEAASPPLTPASRQFPKAGLALLRDADNYLLISCGPNGQGHVGGHAHNDKLAFELSTAAGDWIVDPGTFVYTSDPAERNAFRSTRAHSTLEVVGHEQNPFRPGQLFCLPDLTQARLISFKQEKECDVFEGEHHGYHRVYPGILHRRRFVWEKPHSRWRITDHLVSEEPIKPEGLPPLKGRLQLAPNLVVELSVERHRLVLRQPKESASRLEISWTPGEILSPKLTPGLYSPSYGLKIPHL